MTNLANIQLLPAALCAVRPANIAGGRMLRGNKRPVAIKQLAPFEGGLVA